MKEPTERTTAATRAARASAATTTHLIAGRWQTSLPTLTSKYRLAATTVAARDRVQRMTAEKRSPRQHLELDGGRPWRRLRDPMIHCGRDARYAGLECA
jgi:hypothetical protein